MRLNRKGTYSSRRGRILAAVLALSAFTAACAEDEPDAPAASPSESQAEETTVTFKTSEYAFDAPEEFAGGLVNIVLDNSSGKESHEAGMLKLDEGKTAKDYVDGLLAGGPPPTFAKDAGGPGPVVAGKMATYSANLDAGTYILLCFVPAPDGADHYTKGMSAEVAITDGEEGDLPEADVTIGAKEMEFTGTEGLKAGEQTVKVTNDGQQVHHWAMFTLAEGSKPDDLKVFFKNIAQKKPPGKPPFTELPGLVSTFGPGGEAVRTLDLQKGTYAMMCFIPDTDGTPHYEKGMLKQIDIT